MDGWQVFDTQYDDMCLKSYICIIYVHHIREIIRTSYTCNHIHIIIYVYHIHEIIYAHTCNSYKCIMYVSHVCTSYTTRDHMYIIMREIIYLQFTLSQILFVHRKLTIKLLFKIICSHEKIPNFTRTITSNIVIKLRSKWILIYRYNESKNN